MPYVKMYQSNQHQLYNYLRLLDKYHEGLIFIFVGKIAENYAALIDKSKHDVRDWEPYFYPDDDVKWRIR